MQLIPAWFQRALQLCGYILLLAALVWSVIALWFFPVLPDPLPKVAALGWLLSLGLLFFGGGLFGVRPLLARHFPWLPTWVTHGIPHTAAILSALVGFGIICALWTLKKPSDDRIWLSDQARVPMIHFGDEAVRIENVRNTIYRTDLDFDVQCESREYRLDDIRTLDVMIEPFMEWQGISHFLMSFGFANGEHLCVSVEARVEKEEGFGILPALFKEYELIYILGDERDLLHRRVNLQNHKLFLFPIRSESREQIRSLFVLVLNHAAKLKTRPQFYNTLTLNCTNTQLRHIEYLTASHFPWFDYRLILPGYVDAMLHAHGAIDNTLPLDEVRKLSMINKNATPPEGRSTVEWSAAIRRDIPLPAHPSTSQSVQ
jgi:hypothetical protein